MRKILPKLFSTVLVFNALARQPVWRSLEQRTELEFLNFYGAQEPIPGANSSRLCSLVGRFDNPISFHPVPSPHRLF